MTVELSDRAVDIIRNLRWRFHLSFEEALERVVLDWSPSSALEVKNQQIAREVALRHYLQTEGEKTPEQAWRAGFREGWTQFQVRKASSLPVRQPHVEPT